MLGENGGGATEEAGIGAQVREGDRAGKTPPSMTTPERISPTSTLLTRDRALAGRSKSAVQQNSARVETSVAAQITPRSNSLSPALIAHSRGRTYSAAQRRPYIPTANMLTEASKLSTSQSLMASAQENKRRKKSSSATIRRLTEMTEPPSASRYKYPFYFVSVLLCCTSIAFAVTVYLLVAQSIECGA